MIFLNTSHLRCAHPRFVLLLALTLIITIRGLSPSDTPSKYNDNDIRGNFYGSANGSSIPTPSEVAQTLDVKPADPNATVLKWRRAWAWHKRILPILHSLDSCKPPDSSLNLACLWWKALAGNDASSPVYDDGLSYDLLPKGFRKLVGRKVRKFYPRLHHANVEMRTAFLDKTISDIISCVYDQNDTTKTKIRLVSLGAGYDVRSVKFLERGLIDLAIELDLPQVVGAKQKLLGSRRLLKRRPHLIDLNMPLLIGADFNDVDGLKVILRDMLETTESTDIGTMEDNLDPSIKWHTIFVFEGVMIYLNEGVPSSLLDATSSVLKELGLSGSLCFADRLENVPEGDYELGSKELERNGWQLKYWLPKPGLARHMGSATLRY